MAAVPPLHDDHDEWVPPYSQKYKGYIVDFMSFVEISAASNNVIINNSGVQQVTNANGQQILANFQERLDNILDANQQAQRAWMEEQFNMMVMNQRRLEGRTIATEGRANTNTSAANNPLAQAELLQY